MKSVFIVFNQAFTSRVEYMLEQLGIRGFTFFEQVQGVGSHDGQPHRGTHTWPEMNSAVITMWTIPGSPNFSTASGNSTSAARR